MVTLLERNLINSFIYIIAMCGIILYPVTNMANTMHYSSTQQDQFSIWGNYVFGPINGFEQIPSGGREVSTTQEKPTFSQLGIRQHGLWEGGAHVWIKKCLQISTSAQLLKMRSDTVLNEPLISHDIDFPAGSHLSTVSDYDIYHLDFGSFWQASNKIRLNGLAGAALLHFNYQINSGSLSTSRHFNHISPEVIIESIYLIQPRIDWRLHASSTVPSISDFSEQDVNSEIRYYPAIHRFPHVALMVKTGCLFINFKDKQSTPNHMKVNFGPYIGIGVVMNF